MKTPYWERTLKRPAYRGNPAILSYEIYSLKTYPDEAATVRTLNDLVEEGKAHLFFKGGFVWYAKT